jgi:predicted site-specific integrase-resolvase
MATKTLDIQKIINEDFCTRAEAAVYLEVAERTLENWVRQGIAPPVTLIRKRQFFERTALAEFKRRKRKGARS